MENTTFTLEEINELIDGHIKTLTGFVLESVKKENFDRAMKNQARISECELLKDSFKIAARKK